jgi:hypothetical protein
MRGHRQVAVSTLAEEPAALIGHGGVCEGEESMSTACRLLSTRKGGYANIEAMVPRGPRLN